MSEPLFVGFDTSNYTTSAAVCDADGEVLLNARTLLPVREGERGLRQSDAVFFHVRNLPDLLGQVRETVRGRVVRAVGCSVGPRRAEGSYMPCFLSGIMAAEAFAAAIDVPVLRFAHQEGHIMAALHSAGAESLLTAERFAAFHVSGGTTEVLLVRPRADGFDTEIAGGSRDLHAGQAIDRAGVMMGMGFPCGKELEAVAAMYEGRVPTPRVCVKADGWCHFSGLENQARKLWEETGDRACVSAYVQRFCAKTLEGLTAALDLKYPGIPIVYAGGVMSNRYLQSVLAKRAETYFAAPEFSADNAAGVALLTRRSEIGGTGAWQ